MKQGLRIVIFCAVLGMSSATPVFAQDQIVTDNAISEQVLETRAKEIGRALRCVVCQNQSIEESDASLAEDMRHLVRVRIKNGDSNEDVMKYMRSRYGDFVLLDPPVQPNTYILWALPFVIMLLGLVWFMRQAIKANKT